MNRCPHERLLNTHTGRALCARCGAVFLLEGPLARGELLEIEQLARDLARSVHDGARPLIRTHPRRQSVVFALDACPGPDIVGRCPGPIGSIGRPPLKLDELEQLAEEHRRRGADA